MGIFGKTNQKSTEKIGTTIISNGTVLKGIIETKGSIFINGRFEGIIIAQEDVTVGKEGEVLGEIKTKTLTVNGLIDGLIETDKINILSSGRVIGKLKYDDFVIEKNGIFEGEGKKKNSTLSSQYNTLEVNKIEQIEPKIET